MNVVEAEYIFSENLYQLKERVLVLLPDPWNSLPPDQISLLGKILNSIKLSLDGVTIIHNPSPSLEKLKNLQPSHLLSFGVPVPSVNNLYSPENVEGIHIIYSEPLDKLNDITKKSLWLALRSAFSL